MSKQLTKDILIMKKLFKPVKDFEHIYHISNTGILKNIKTGRILNGEIHYSGYVRCNLIDKINNKKRRTTIHRLVAETFLNNPNNLPVVDHIDRNRANNRVTNLRWVSESTNHENVNRKNRTTKAKSVIAINLLNNKKKKFKSLNSACNELNLNYCSAHQTLNNLRKSTNNYVIKYE